MIANYCMRSESLTEHEQESFAEIIEQAEDDRPETGVLRFKNSARSAITHEIAIMALELCESPNPTSVWVGNCAYKELETLVKIPERRRLISRASKTAQKYFSGS